ncbi:hypothetical protein RF679_13285 [Undibacterium cyanobacteriorum]|uniref:Uncharacterized protein n=1 Tax=Undibacterium cyanobacteriorum TaxID=3073561 RepID=A0ABY9REK9_9BURK|nr:hypothetical protein [Undibacterium sp. 20NA77.5]WMW79619.1 hypothetical protein RF679_13285 [Undibacterium sp. 20NA77.5]
MNLYVSNSFSDEEGPPAMEGKTAYLQGSKEELLELCAFFSRVEKHLAVNNGAPFHLHFRDESHSIDKSNAIDVVITLD